MPLSFVKDRTSLFRHSVASLFAVMVTVFLAVIDTHNEYRLDDQKMQAIVDGIADSIDRQLQAWRLALSAMSVSSALVAPYDINAFSSEARKFASITDTNIAFYRVEGEFLTLLSHTRVPDADLPKRYPKDVIPVYFDAVSKVQKTNTYAISDLFLGPIAGEYLSSIIIPVPGERLGYELLSLNFSSLELSNLLTNIELPTGFIVGVVDSRGILGGRSERAADFIGKRIPAWYQDYMAKYPSGLVEGGPMAGTQYERYRFAFTHLKEAEGWTVSLLIPPTAYPPIFINPLSIFFAMSALIGGNFLAWMLGASQRQQLDVERRYQALTHQLLDELPGAVLRGRLQKHGIFDVQLCLGRLAETLVQSGRFKFDKALSTEVAKRDYNKAETTAFEFDVHDNKVIFRLFVFEVPNPDHSSRDFNIYVLDITNQRSAEISAINSARLAALGQMAATLAHEMSQPINVISLAADNADSLLREQDMNAISSKITKIREFAAKSRYLIENLLSFARGDIADQPLRDVDLGRAIFLAEDLTRSLLAREKIALKLSLRETPIFVRGRPIELENIFVNLIVNSADAFQQGGRQVDREIAIDVEDQGEFVMVRVADNAGGIPEEILPQIFEPFITTKPQGHGTGLGLAFVIGHIRSWNGDISVRNANGGAVFEIRLQVAKWWPTKG
jgi:signal transduction histidine kinase